MFRHLHACLLTLTPAFPLHLPQPFTLALHFVDAAQITSTTFRVGVINITSFATSTPVPLYIRSINAAELYALYHALRQAANDASPSSFSSVTTPRPTSPFSTQRPLLFWPLHPSSTSFENWSIASAFISRWPLSAPSTIPQTPFPDCISCRHLLLFSAPKPFP